MSKISFVKLSNLLYICVLISFNIVLTSNSNNFSSQTKIGINSNANKETLNYNNNLNNNNNNNDISFSQLSSQEKTTLHNKSYGTSMKIKQAHLSNDNNLFNTSHSSQVNSNNNMVDDIMNNINNSLSEGNTNQTYSNNSGDEGITEDTENFTTGEASNSESNNKNTNTIVYKLKSRKIKNSSILLQQSLSTDAKIEMSNNTIISYPEYANKTDISNKALSTDEIPTLNSEFSSANNKANDLNTTIVADSNSSIASTTSEAKANDSNNANIDQEDLLLQINNKLKNLNYTSTDPFYKFIDNEINEYYSNPEKFESHCKTYTQSNLNHTVTSILIVFSNKNTIKETEIINNNNNNSTDNIKNNEDTTLQPATFTEYINNCINIYSNLDSSYTKLQKSMEFFNEKLNNEIKEFEKQFPPTLGDSFLDYFFSYNYFKKNFFKSLIGKKDSSANISEEYEKSVFRNKRLDALISLSFETLLFENHEKYDKYYNNNENKLKSKTPLENLSLKEVITTKEFLKWANSFITEHPEFNLTVESLTSKFSGLFSSIVNDFKNKYTAHLSIKQTLHNSLYY